MSVRPFDVRGPLPTGVTMLEASAGTGKTFTIAALAARYVAEGTPLERLLLVTFTRMATGELRDRVRERLVAVEQGLARALAGAPPRDEVVALLAEAGPEVVRARRHRLSRALADFDAATIATTHGFCQEVLSGLGVVGDVEPGTAFVEDLDDLLEEVVDDLYVRRFHRLGLPQFERREAMLIARAAVDNPTAPVVPAAAPETSKEAMRVRLALRVRTELEARKRRGGVMTYDDLLTRLKGTLEGPAGPEAARRLRERYGVVLVDEFQDTDPVQWDILRLAFGGGGVTLVLIGDPKQAIYAFRGADVYAYLAAAREAGERATLDVNWRSDQALIDAYDALFGNARLGHEGIEYRRVRAAAPNREPGLEGAPVPAALRLRLVPREDIETTARGYARAPAAREHIAADVAGCLVELLSSPATVRTESGGREPIAPSHVAVLVRTHRTGSLVRDALGAAGIPAVISGAGSVFGTAPAHDWLVLLEALERPASSPHARSAALTRFLGWRAERVSAAGDAEWEEVHRRLHAWAHVLRTRGVAALLEAVTAAEGLPGRVLAAAGGERDLTDLRHVGELLHAAAAEEQMGAAALTAWLRRRIAAAREEAGHEERSRRLESDADAVQVLTVHRSKGLEFPVVCCPDLWEPSRVPEGGEPVYFHDPDAGDARTVDVGLGGPDFPAHGRLHRDEQRGEDLRLAYVALTRARHQALVWWAASWDSRHSALGRLLFSRQPDGTVPAEGRGTPTDGEAEQRMRALAAEAPGCIAAERRDAGPAANLARAPPPGCRARRGALRPHARPRLAPHLLQRHHGRRGRAARGQRAGGAHTRRRAAGRGRGAVRVRRRGRPAARGAVAAGRDAGRRPGGDVRAPRARGDRLRGRGSRRGVDRAGRRRARAAARRGRRPGRGRQRPARRDRDAARPARRRREAARRRARGSPRRARLRAAAGRRRRAGRPPHAGRDRRRPARARARGRPARGLRRPAGRSRAAPGGARLPDRQHRPRRAPARRAVRARRLQDELARRRRRRADRLAPPSVRAGRGDAPRPLLAAGAAVRRRPPPLPALAAPRLRAGAQPRRGALPVPARDERRRDAGRRWDAVRRLLRGSRTPRS